MAGRNVEGMHAVGDLFIKDKCQLCVKLCVASLFMHFLWVFPMYVACLFILLFCMNLCICIVFVCFNFVYSSKILCGIAQQVVWHVTYMTSHNSTVTLPQNIKYFMVKNTLYEDIVQSQLVHMTYNQLIICCTNH
jgi:hypothetical protein